MAEGTKEPLANLRNNDFPASPGLRCRVACRDDVNNRDAWRGGDQPYQQGAQMIIEITKHGIQFRRSPDRPQTDHTFLDCRIADIHKRSKAALKGHKTRLAARSERGWGDVDTILGRALK